MAPKKVNAKAAAANERKAEVAAVKKGAKDAQKEAEVSAQWASGAKDGSKKEAAAQKKAELAAKKAERDQLLAQEEKEASVKKPLKGEDKKAAQRTNRIDQFLSAKPDTPEYSASGLDGALDLLDATAATKSSDGVERHPEKRMKSAWAAFEEREMPLLKAEQPGLRLTQYKQALQKKWKKSPENPMNQASIAYNAARNDELEAISAQKESVLEAMRSK